MFGGLQNLEQDAIHYFSYNHHSGCLTKKKEHYLQNKWEGESEDAAAERSRLLKNVDKYQLRLEDLSKSFPGIGSAPEKIALKCITLGVENGECFGLLGPNGAGKSTTINMVCGLYGSTHGTAFINGYNIATHGEEVHKTMGVCPQENLLWDDLTGPEHLKFYGRLKGLEGKELKLAVYEGLKQVNLHNEQTKKAKEYSGGMKRRLSVACALIGNPDVILLDEPTTGLDPASRTKLWEVIKKCKEKTAMILTTHAMEEADALCDRVGIIVNGEFTAINTCAELKKRFGKGYKVVITSRVNTNENIENITKFMQIITPGAILLNSLAGTSNFEVPSQSVKLSKVFAEMESKREEFKITDWGISNTTLEEVVLRITTNII